MDSGLSRAAASRQGVLAACSARFIFRTEGDLLCAAAAAGSGRPACQMGFSSDGHLRKRRLGVKDVAPTAGQSHLPAMGGASLLRGRGLLSVERPG